MTRSLPRGILETQGQGGMADGVDSVVEIAGTVGLARVSKTCVDGKLKHDAEGGGDECGVDSSFADFEHGSTNLCFEHGVKDMNMQLNVTSTLSSSSSSTIPPIRPLAGLRAAPHTSVKFVRNR